MLDTCIWKEYDNYPKCDIFLYKKVFNPATVFTLLVKFFFFSKKMLPPVIISLQEHFHYKTFFLHVHILKCWIFQIFWVKLIRCPKQIKGRFLECFLFSEEEKKCSLGMPCNNHKLMSKIFRGFKPKLSEESGV